MHIENGTEATFNKFTFTNNHGEKEERKNEDGRHLAASHVEVGRPPCKRQIQ